MRRFRAWLYRQLPFGAKAWHLKRRAGHERRWNLETGGFTKEGFFSILEQRILRGIRPGLFMELAAGDGLVGSLGVWLEQMDGWKVEAWEHRTCPALFFQKNRPCTRLHHERLTEWTQPAAPDEPVGVTTRGVREASGLCRAIRQGRIRPGIVGIWNPSRQAVWERRLRPCGYRLELAWHNMEFYLDGRRRTDDGGRRTDDGRRKARKE